VPTSGWFRTRGDEHTESRKTGMKMLKSVSSHMRWRAEWTSVEISETFFPRVMAEPTENSAAPPGERVLRQSNSAMVIPIT
jgi:hypothetical protein